MALEQFRIIGEDIHQKSEATDNPIHILYDHLHRSRVAACLASLIFCLGVLAFSNNSAAAAKMNSSIIYTYDLTSLLNSPVSTLEERQHLWDELQFLVSLQALVNRQHPKLYFFAVGDNGSTDRFWFDWMREPNQWLHNCKVKRISDFDEALQIFHGYLGGLVVWDGNVPSTSNVAATIAGVDSLEIVRYDPGAGSLFSDLTKAASGPKMPVKVWLIHKDGTSLFTGTGDIPDTNTPSTGSAKDDAYVWAGLKYLKTGRCNPTVMGYYPDAFWIRSMSPVPPGRTLLLNQDYFISHKAFFFDLSPWDDESPRDDPNQPLGSDARTMKFILRLAYDQLHSARHEKYENLEGNKPASGMIMVGGFTPWDQKYTDFTGGKHGGVATEWRYAEILSCYNAYMDADAPGINAMANASFYCHYPLAKHYPQMNLLTLSSLKNEGLVQSDGDVAPKVYVGIYVGDYDSSAWLYQKLPELWTDKTRGEIPIAWAFNPNLSLRFPVGMAYTRETATRNDSFTTGDSGAGYLNPGYLDPPRKWSDLPSGLGDWVTHCERFYDRWDLRVTGFIIDGNAPPMDKATLEAYAHFSPGGFVAQKLPAYQGLINGTPYLAMASDLDFSSKKAAQFIAQNAPAQAPAFRVYRTILWSPSGLKTMYDDLEKLRPDIRVVDLNTLMLLLKIHLQHEAK